MSTAYMNRGIAHTDLPSLLLVLALAAIPLTYVQGASTNAIALPELMHKLSQVKTSGGRFVERKYLSILSEPLVLHGRVLYQAPDYVMKAYDGAGGERYEVRGDRLTIDRPDGTRRELSIDDHPVLRAFVESYRGTLAGNLEDLKKYFDLELGGTMDDWRLLLLPKLPELTQYLTAVVILGHGATVYEVDTREAGGDYSVMRLEDSSE